jgi:hypothetical protein
VPLGYKVVDRKLMIDEAEAPIVRLIFERYCALGSMIALMRELRDREVVTRLRTRSSGKAIGGIAFTNGPLAYPSQEPDVSRRDQPWPIELCWRASGDRRRGRFR